MSVAEHWYNQPRVAPSWFGSLGTQEAAQVLWNLACYHGDAVGLLRELERLRCEAVDKTVRGLMHDLDAASNQEPDPASAPDDSPFEAPAMEDKPVGS